MNSWRGFCARCKEYRGDGLGWEISFVGNFPVCDKCGSFVDLEEEL